MTLCEDEREELLSMIPLYVKGLLSSSEVERLERAVPACPELVDELEKWRDIEKAYGLIECSLPQPSPAVYRKIKDRLSEEESHGFFQKFLSSLTWNPVIIAVQFLIIITLAVSLVSIKSGYRTSTSTVVIKGERLLRINVVFTESATEQEIRNLLLQVNGKIIDGPHGPGLYVIGVAAERSSDEVVEALKKSTIVTLAERAY